MGEVIDGEKAENSICSCKSYRMGGKDREICWSKGVVGALDKKQVGTYCVEKEKEPLPKKVDTSVLVHKIMEGESLED